MTHGTVIHRCLMKLDIMKHGAMHVTMTGATTMNYAIIIAVL